MREHPSTHVRNGSPRARAACGARAAHRRPGQNAQGMVEFALVIPLVLFGVFFCIDIGRLVYTYNAISSAARDGARTISLGTQGSSDCLALARVESVGKGFPILADPNSVSGNTDPNNPSGSLQPSNPGPGQGYVYIWPAVATGNPPDAAGNCGGTGTCRYGTATIKHVAVQVEYRFQPMTPIVSQLVPTISVRSVSVGQDEPTLSC